MTWGISWFESGNDGEGLAHGEFFVGPCGIRFRGATASAVNYEKIRSRMK